MFDSFKSIWDKKEKKISIVSKGTDTATNSLEVLERERYTLRIV